MSTRFGPRTRMNGFDGRVMGWGHPLVVKSVQYCSATATTAATSFTATITAVVVANSVVEFLGAEEVGNADVTEWNVVITNATTITFARNTGAADSALARAVVTEYYPQVIKSNQDFTATIASGGITDTETITAVVVAKTMLVPRGLSYNTADATVANNRAWMVLTNATTVTVGRGAAPATILLVKGTALEFY